MTKVNSIEELAYHLGKKVRVADITGSIGKGYQRDATTGRFYEGVLQKASEHGTFALLNPTEFGKDGRPIQIYSGLILIDADSVEARNVLSLGYNFDNALYFMALGMGVDPNDIPKETRTRLEGIAENVPIESLRTMDVLGGAIKAGFEALHQQGLDSVETYPLNEGVTSIIHRFIQNTDKQKAVAYNYLFRLKLPKPLEGAYVEAISSFYAMQLDPRQKESHERKMQKLVDMQYQAMIP